MGHSHWTQNVSLLVGLEVIWGMPGPHTKVSVMVAMAHGTISGQEAIPPGTTKACAQPGLYGTQDGGWGAQSIFGPPTSLSLLRPPFL